MKILIIPFKLAAITAAVILLQFLPCSESHGAQQLLARVTVESDDVYIGQPFFMRITIIGSTDTERPDLSGLRDFNVRFRGGTNNSSHSVSIINGKVTRNVKREYIYNYTLTPLRSGVLEIPSISVRAEDRVLNTNSVRINVKEPQETEDFKLRLRLSENSCYVGEPVLLNVTWYLRKDVRSFEFTAPFLETEYFEIEEPDVEIENSKQYFRVPISDYEFIAEKGRDTLAAKSYASLKFSLAITPVKPGVFTIPEFIVSCETGSSVRDRFFKDFFSEGIPGRQNRQKKYVIPSNTPTLNVRELPLEGRPAGFTGHIGKYSISASAEPLEVNIGDPITLKVTLEGPEYLDNVVLPPLSSMEGFTDNFKIPDERASGQVENGKKVFTQTIRPVNADVSQIPPVRIISFDTDAGQYRTVKTDPIPLTVNPTRIVKASDAEGISRSGEVSALESWKDGIAYNYEGGEVLAKRDYGFSAVISRGWNVLIISLPPALFLLILSGTMVVRRRESDPLGKRSRRAFRVLRRRLSGIRKSSPGDQDTHGEVLEALKEYFAGKLCRRSLSMTTDEIEQELIRREVDPDAISSLREVLEQCEAGTYAGQRGSGDTDIITGRVEKLIKRIDKQI